jgi:small GTP-binding protein
MVEPLCKLSAIYSHESAQLKMSVITKKICLLGDFNVGKTSLIRRFIEDKFSDQYLSTVGVKVSRKSLDIRQNLEIQQINLLIWDLEGHTRFKSITPTYLKGASGSIIVGDLTRSSTLEGLKQHIDLSLHINPHGSIVIALNKADLVPREKLDKVIELYRFNTCIQGINTYLTSAKTGEYVNDMFDELSKNILHASSK